MASTKTFRKYSDIQALLHQRGANTKAASAQAAGETTTEKKAEAPTVPSVPEKDPNEKGVVKAQPASHFDGEPAKANTPESKKNDGETPVLKAPTPAKTVEGEEPASFNMKIAKMVDAVQKFRGNFKKAMDEKILGENVPAGARSSVNAPKADGPKTAPKAESRKGDKGGEAPAETEKKAEDDAPAEVKEKDPTEKETPTKRKDTIKGIAPSGENTDSPTKREAADASGSGATSKEAGAEPSEAEILAQFSPEYHYKLASEILKTEEGRQLALAVMQQSLGAEQAENIVKAAAIMEQQAEEFEAWQASGEAQAAELWNSASPEERAQITKIASVHNLVKNGLKEEWQKAAYDMGAASSAEAMDQAPQPGAEGAPGAESAMPPGAEEGAEGAPGGEAGEGEVSEEDIMAVLQALVESGQLPPEEAQQILAQLFGGAAGGGAPGAEGAMPPGAEGGMPPGAEGGMPPGAEGGMPGAEAGAGAPELPPEAKEARAILQKSASAMKKLAAPATPNKK